MTPRPPNSTLLTMAEVRAELRASKATVSRAINGKLANCTRLVTVPLGRLRMVRPETLEAWLRENER